MQCPSLAEALRDDDGVPHPASAPRLDRVRVLVVDDDAEARDAIRSVLQLSGADVIEVANAAEALAAMSRAVPDVLLSDIAMPGTDGYALLGQARTRLRGAHVPAAALTAYAAPQDRTLALLSGYQVYLAKPFEAFELVALVAELAGS